MKALLVCAEGHTVMELEFDPFAWDAAWACWQLGMMTHERFFESTPKCDCGAQAFRVEIVDREAEKGGVQKPQATGR